MERRELLVSCLLAPARVFAGESAMELRPHHLIDILSSYGNDEKFEPHPYGHALHIVGPKVLGNLDLPIKLVVAADEICRPCKHLINGKCDDVLGQLPDKPSKQAYNDNLDQRLLKYLRLKAGAGMTVREYFGIINAKVPGIEKVCTHPKEDEKQRLAGLVNGLKKLGLRKA